MYELPDKKDIAEIIIDENVIKTGAKPKLVKTSSKTKKSA
jgi:ATP-dependent protease Clp ATPase subunit